MSFSKSEIALAEVEGNKIHCSPRDQSLSDLLYSKEKQKQNLKKHHQPEAEILAHEVEKVSHFTHARSRSRALNRQSSSSLRTGSQRGRKERRASRSVVTPSSPDRPRLVPLALNYIIT